MLNWLKNALIHWQTTLGGFLAGLIPAALIAWQSGQFELTWKSFAAWLIFVYWGGSMKDANKSNSPHATGQSQTVVATMILILLLILPGSVSAQWFATSKVEAVTSWTANAIPSTAFSSDTVLLVSGSGVKFDTITAPFLVKVGISQQQWIAGVPIAVASPYYEIFSCTYVNGDTLVLSSRALYGTLARAWGAGSTIATSIAPGYEKQLQDSVSNNRKLVDSIFAGTPTFAGPVTIKGTTNQLKLGAATHLLTISSTAPAGAAQTYTIPDAGGAASFVMTAGTQTIGGSTTFTLGVPISAVTNQLVLGTTNTTTISATAPASSRTYTLPDVGSAGIISVVGTGNVQSIVGDGAITIPTGSLSIVQLSKASAAAITIAAPAAGTDDGKRIIVYTSTAQAHVITCSTDGFNAKGSSGTATFTAAVGNAVELIAYNGHWWAFVKTGVTTA